MFYVAEQPFTLLALLNSFVTILFDQAGFLLPTAYGVLSFF
jgi:hypothetical protein